MSPPRAGALDPAGREELLRPPIAYERVERRPEGLVRIDLRRAFADSTLAVEMNSLRAQSLGGDCQSCLSKDKVQFRVRYLM
jgi:hypothetical protein